MSRGPSLRAGDSGHDRRTRSLTFQEFLVSEARTGKGTHPPRIALLWRSRAHGNRSAGSDAIGFAADGRGAGWPHATRAARLRHAAGGNPSSRLKARLNAPSDS
jgi:hypothetical protein